MKHFFLSLLGCILLFNLQAATIETKMVHSDKMKIDLPVLAIVPEYASNNARCPVIYLLHGYGGNSDSWIQIKPDLGKIADKNGVIFICPDAKNSWYWDSPLDSSYRFETYVSTELVNWVDKQYPTIADRKARAITGLSMGGHGALWLAFRHKNTYGAAGSTSGGVDIRPFPDNWEMKKQLGEEMDNQERWDNYTVINQVDKIKNGDLDLIIDCGFSDFFFEVNNDLHDKLLANSINHDFLTRPGVHNGQYWNNSIDYQILFFVKFFIKNKVLVL